MPTLALRAPTVDASGEDLPGGQSYILFANDRITVGDLVAEKVRAELRKARDTGSVALCSLPALLPAPGPIGLTPLDEGRIITQALRALLSGHYLLLFKEHPRGALRPLVDSGEVLHLTPRSVIMFMAHMAQPLPVSAADADEDTSYGSVAEVGV